MSYIHDALKSSSQQRAARQSAGSPAEGTPQAVTADTPPGGHVGRILLVLLLVLLAVWFWQARGSLTSEGDSEVTSGANKETGSGMVETETGEGASALTEGKSSIYEGVKIELVAPAVQPENPDTKAPGHTVRQQPLAVTEPVTTAPEVVPETTEPDPYAGLPYLRQLPASQQRELQDIRFSVHIYAEEPASRLVKYQDRILREQDFLRSGLRVVAIIPRAVVLQYQDTRFKVPAL